jgi:hypothetical protein
MARKTLRELTRLAVAAKVANPAFVAGLRMSAIGTDKTLKFIGHVTIGGDTFEIATDNGKLKTFTDADGFLKMAAKVAEKGNGVYSVEIETGALLSSSVPGDLKAWANSQITRLNKAKTSQQAVIVGIDDQIGLMVGWENGNAAQQTKKSEAQAQRAAVVTDIAAIDTELARLAVIAAG